MSNPAGRSEFDPDQPLPGPPEPWAGAAQPIDRGAPPWFMTEMIAAEPAFAERILDRLASDGSPERLAAELRRAAGRPIIVVGCGTSEHGAIGVAAILSDAWRTARLAGPAPVPVQSFEASLEPQGGLCLAISHDGGTWATTRALETARSAGARTALITVSGRAPGAHGVDVVLETHERDQSYCHTIGYTSPLLAATAVGAALTGRPVDPAVVRSLMAAGIDPAATSAAEAIATGLAGTRPILTVGTGADRGPARELVLKLEEGTHIPAASRNLETFAHGHLPSTDGATGLVLIMTERRGREERLERARQVLTAARVVGIRVAGIFSTGVSAELDADLTPLGRIVIPEAPGLPAPVAALLGSATPLQLVVERLARIVGTNPDPIRRTEAAYAEAAATLEG